MDKLKAFESFVSVAVRGSLTAAAKAEGVAPAIMGRRLDALEEHLGVKLLVRTTRRISLTHEGSAFLEDAQRLLVDLANAEASVSAGGLQASGHLRITAPAGFGRRHVAPLVPRFVGLHPEVSLSLNLSDRLVDLVNEGFDCAVRVGDMPDSSLVSVRLADNRPQIEQQIRELIGKTLAEEKLMDKITVSQVQVRAIVPADVIVQSANDLVRAQNELKTKEVEVQTAKKEAERIAALNANAGAIGYMNAMANMKIAEGVASGKVQTIVVPYDFKGIVNAK